MWVCRAGKDAVYLDYYIETSRIYLAWDGFKINLKDIAEKKEYRAIVSKEKGTENPTSISNWAGQLNSFANEMKKGDYVLIPHKGSQFFELVQVSGEYEYYESNNKKLYHSREIKNIASNIPKSIFPQSIQYGLRAYRTIYKVKNEEDILDIIKRWKQKETIN